MYTSRYRYWQHLTRCTRHTRHLPQSWHHISHLTGPHHTTPAVGSHVYVTLSLLTTTHARHKAHTAHGIFHNHGTIISHHGSISHVTPHPRYLAHRTHSLISSTTRHRAAGRRSLQSAAPPPPPWFPRGNPGGPPPGNLRLNGGGGGLPSRGKHIIIITSQGHTQAGEKPHPSTTTGAANPESLIGHLPFWLSHVRPLPLLLIYLSIYSTYCGFDRAAVTYTIYIHIHIHTYI